MDLPRRSIAVLLFLATFALVGRARGEEVTPDACIAAHEAALTLHHEGRLRLARERLVFCGDPACPTVIRDECASLLDEVDRTIPTVVLEAYDATGVRQVEVSVTLHGTLLLDRLDGTAVQLDPGERELVFEVSGCPAVIRRFTLKEGEQGRRERIDLPCPAAPDPVPPAATSPAPTAPVAPPVTTSAPGVYAPFTTPGEPGATGSMGTSPAADVAPRGRGMRIAGGIITFTGMAALATGGYFGVYAMIEQESYEKHCGPVVGAPEGWCDPTGAKANELARINADLSTGFFIAGGVVTATGLGLALGAPRSSVALTAGPQRLVLSGRF